MFYIRQKILVHPKCEILFIPQILRYWTFHFCSAYSYRSSKFVITIVALKSRKKANERSKEGRYNHRGSIKNRSIEMIQKKIILRVKTSQGAIDKSKILLSNLGKIYICFVFEVYP